MSLVGRRRRDVPPSRTAYDDLSLLRRLRDDTFVRNFSLRLYMLKGDALAIDLRYGARGDPVCTTYAYTYGEALEQLAELAVLLDAGTLYRDGDGGLGLIPRD